MAVYLLHLARKFHHVQHYLGYTEDVEKRLEIHRHGRGSKFTQALKNEGIDFDLAKVWEKKGRKFERALKNTHSLRDYCPICMGKKVRNYQTKTGYLKDQPELFDMSAPVSLSQAELDWLPY